MLFQLVPNDIDKIVVAVSSLAGTGTRVLSILIYMAKKIWKCQTSIARRMWLEINMAIL